ncbi:MAG: helix-turn-helix transcriptional regulator [Oscillospiraceae bacterium]|nr:helix-turn-helix transcriptional regulator [Oscillospiraceae bacterium]
MLGQTIRKLRQERGMKQEDLGIAVGVTKQSVSNWENENIMPSIDLLIRLADCFGVSTDYLLGRAQRITLDATGLTDTQATHIQFLIDDLRNQS